MESLGPSLVAVLGTLLGVVTTYVFQARHLARTELRQRAEQRRQERLTAYNDFVAAVTSLRQGVVSLWFRKRQEQRDGGRSERSWMAHLDADRLGAAADHAKFRVRLVTDDPEIGALTETVFEPISAIERAPDLDTVKALETRSQETLGDFIAAARRELDRLP